jgi:DNA modification methylase
MVVRLSDSVEIIHGDCLTILPIDCDIIITDQPYGTGWIRGGGKKSGEFKRRKEGAEWDVFNLSWMDAAPPRVAAFCPVQGVWDMCQRLPRPHVLKYRKTNPAPYGVPCEPIVSSHAMPGKWEKESYNGDNSLHPCQKPVDLLAWLVNGLTVEGETVCDPFMGSGSMGIACIRTGRKFIGIEKDARYFEIARRRLENELRQGLLPLEHNNAKITGGRQ